MAFELYCHQLYKNSVPSQQTKHHEKILLPVPVPGGSML
jgi:hypothetical protein